MLKLKLKIQIGFNASSIRKGSGLLQLQILVLLAVEEPCNDSNATIMIATNIRLIVVGIF